MSPDLVEFLVGSLAAIGFIGGCIFWMLVFRSVL